MRSAKQRHRTISPRVADDLATAIAGKEALQKVVGEMTGQIGELAKRLEAIESQEVPPTMGTMPNSSALSSIFASRSI